ncbi:MAG: hypothetical protein AAFX06_10860 [Planctomycetota bacterium]
MSDEEIDDDNADLASADQADPNTDPDPNSNAEKDSGPDQEEEQGPGCLPAVLAATVLMGITFLVICAGGTWYIYQHRDVIALRTVETAFIPAVEQSLMEPEEKAATVQLLRDFGDEIKRGQVEPWQASGAMERITRLPIVEWGQLRAVEAFARSKPADFDDAQLVQFKRLRKGVELGKLTNIDFKHILESVTEPDRSLSGFSLVDPLTVDAVTAVIERAEIISNGIDAPAEPTTDVTIDTIVRRQIEAGLDKGGF